MAWEWYCEFCDKYFSKKNELTTPRCPYCKRSNDVIPADDIIRCDECGITMNKNDSIETADGRTLCSGCDAKRLEKENSTYVDYYCENCGKEDLEHYVIDDIGAVFCSERCFRQFYATDIENKEYHERHLIIKRV